MPYRTKKFKFIKMLRLNQSSVPTDDITRRIQPSVLRPVFYWVGSLILQSKFFGRLSVKHAQLYKFSPFLATTHTTVAMLNPSQQSV